MTLSLFILLFFYIFRATSSDPYKMVVVSGKPQNSPLFQPMKFNFSTCVDYCLTKDNCMAVYSENMAVENCQVYYNVQLDSIVEMDKSAGVKTAFKVGLIDKNINITSAKLTCEGFYRGKLSGLENEDEFNYVRERVSFYVGYNQQRFSQYAAVGFWVNGFRKSTCQETTYSKNNCNGTNEFDFDDPTLSENPTGYKWGIGQPSGKLAIGSDCIQYRFNMSTNVPDLDDWKCGLPVSDGGSNAFVGYVCGRFPE
ncbi:hypothetical protein B9Z55_021495 [Caenorhabditis nigoni]|uniref:PAN-3 domain-containing protein n=1 Tax=Caenorhabditis nigoni TaxID=1611254 RepID=A0A2G5TSC6_9PELO|nr:hypothetical protein B9Z55_021495 [Caenorhabditis nigoni]